ncbi:DUF202 domain-containing protein [Mycolicibacterium palauense]|uniref:DUF202 domain-containing protein n=1 Tax=Mycolicibacterium palauense TaxID=2034511 RepID=UPI000BFEEE16|nr:DUF202 domain-containing protein [Mycolicibacterium palauense]
MPRPPADKPGLQIERTHLSWERTAIGMLAIAAIVLFHHTGPLGSGRAALATLAVLLSLACFAVSRARGRLTVATTATGRPAVPSAGAAVPLIGGGTAALAATILIALVAAR